MVTSHLCEDFVWSFMNSSIQFTTIKQEVTLVCEFLIPLATNHRFTEALNTNKAGANLHSTRYVPQTFQKTDLYPEPYTRNDGYTTTPGVQGASTFRTLVTPSEHELLIPKSQFKRVEMEIRITVHGFTCYEGGPHQ